MNLKALHIQFNYDPAETDVERNAARLATPVSQVPGLCWKLWLVNREDHSAGGFYLFQDEPTLCAYLDGPIVAELRHHPALTNLQMKVYDVLTKPSLKTHATMTTLSPTQSSMFDPGL